MSLWATARTSLRIAAVFFAAALLVPFPAGAQLTPAEQTQMVSAHNGVRSAVYPAAVPPLGQVTWNLSLAATAQSWASQCVWGHSNTPGVGENIAASTGWMSMQEVIDLWASEAAVYDYWANDWWPDAGHYSQIIWRSSTGLGCGYTNCSFGHYFVCQYSPPGNWSGEYPYQCDYGSGWEVCRAQWACNDGLDNDGDGFTDYDGGDPGCADASDLSERDPTLPCDDGADNDGDGRIDFDPVTHANPGDQFTPPSGSGDPGCFNPSYLTESPQCQDGAHNDGDGKMDYDAGLSANGVAHPAGPDPYCVGTPWVNIEAFPTCGLGVELALLLPLLMWMWRRRSLH